MKSKYKKVEEGFSFDRISHEMLKEHAEKVKLANEKIIADDLERERRHKLFKAYLDKLETQLKEKNMLSFWTFADRKGFKKFQGTTKKIEKMLKGDIDKYKNRQLAQYIIQFYHNKKLDSMFRSNGQWFSVVIRVFNIDEDGILIGKNRFRECKITWKDADFGVSKFSLKLVEKFLKPLAVTDIDCSSIFLVSL
jgi:hypothetical protein